MTQRANTDLIAAADKLLRSTDTAELLTKAYALTHRMDANRRDTASEGSKMIVAHSLRAQRDLITAEIIRRTTEGA